MSIAGLEVYIVPSSHRPSDTFTDGSKIGPPPASGAAALLPTGDIAVCRVPGIPNSYKAELIGALMGSQLSDDGQKIRLDCRGAIAAATGTKRPVRQAAWVQKVRSSVKARHQQLGRQPANQEKGVNR